MIVVFSVLQMRGNSHNYKLQISYKYSAR